jgi:hypothetical protein
MLVAAVSLPALLSGVAADDRASAGGPAAPDVAIVEASQLISLPRAALGPGVRAVPLRPPSRAAAPAQTDPVLVEYQDFEDEAFPPVGWKIYDVLALQAGERDPRITWGREVCDVDPRVGDAAAAWGVGGGSQGSQLTCGAPYTQAVDSRLTYEDIDTRTFPGGLRVQLRLKVDLPQDEALYICASRNDDPDRLACRYPVDPPAGWITFREPLKYPAAANLPDAEIELIYRDREPQGNHFGVFVDNISIEGLLEVFPTDTPAGPTDTPAPPTETPVPTPVRPTIFLPMAMKMTVKDDLPPPVTAPPVRVQFGTAIDELTGELTSPGHLFQSGMMRLCAKESWRDLAIGTPLRYQWYTVVNGQDEPIPGEGFGRTVTVEQTSGWLSQCALSTDAQGNPLPIPDGIYKVSAFLNLSAVPAVSEVAEVRDLGTPRPPTWTPRPSATMEPTETPLPPGEPSPTPGCVQRVINGDFEQGPDVGWSLTTNAIENDLARVIRQDSAAARDGEWFAVLGGGVNVRDDLQSAATLRLLPAERMESATFKLSLAIVTEERKNGTPDDFLQPMFVNPAGEQSAIRAGFSEENIEADTWYDGTVDVTEQLTQRDGWTSARLVFASRNNATVHSFHLLDEITLEVCEARTIPPARSGAAPALESWPAGRTGLRWPLAVDSRGLRLVTGETDGGAPAAEVLWQRATGRPRPPSFAELRQAPERR